MTVCIAGLFGWNYGTEATPDWGRAAVIISDRMITTGDVQYEPQQLKVAVPVPKVTILIAGDYSFHSQAIAGVAQQLLNKQDAKPEMVALLYGKEIQRLKRREAEDLYLAPLGMNTDTFIAQQKDMSEGFVHSITNQLQSYEGSDVEALVVGTDGQRVEIWHVDSRGLPNLMNDIGFAAIGMGAWHAKSRLMQAGYINRLGFSQALAALFLAKKTAETAPGVGSESDINLIMRSGIEELLPETKEKLEQLYSAYEASRKELGNKAIDELSAFLTDTARKLLGKTGQDTGSNPETDGGLSQPKAQAPRENEGKS